MPSRAAGDLDAGRPSCADGPRSGHSSISAIQRRLSIRAEWKIGVDWQKVDIKPDLARTRRCSICIIYRSIGLLDQENDPDVASFGDLDPVAGLLDERRDID